MVLFTESEKEIMKNEFTYNDTRRYNRNEGDDLFTEHGLDSTQRALLKNVSSKSIILAPFNSTVLQLSELENGNENSPAACRKYLDSGVEVFKKGEVVKFLRNARDADRQYEQNNNCELDNGVYNKFYAESEKGEKKDGQASEEEKNSQDSLENSFRASTIRSEDEAEGEAPKKKEQRKKPMTELEKLESLLEKKNEEEQSSRKEKAPLKNAVPIEEPIVITDEVVLQVVAFGYPQPYVVQSLQNGDANHSTTAYHLLSS